MRRGYRRRAADPGEVRRGTGEKAAYPGTGKLRRGYMQERRQQIQVN
jgi:hypothetical protein